MWLVHSHAPGKKVTVVGHNGHTGVQTPRPSLCNMYILLNIKFLCYKSQIYRTFVLSICRDYIPPPSTLRDKNAQFTTAQIHRLIDWLIDWFVGCLIGCPANLCDMYVALLYCCIGSVVEWLGRRSLVGGLSLTYVWSIVYMWPVRG